MQKLGKSFLIALGAVLALAAIGVLAINLYVQSAGTQARIQRELSTALHVPVRMTGTTLTPWGGLKITGVTVPQPDPAHPGSFFEASSFAAFFQWTPLLRHRLVVTQVSVNDPKVAWYQNANGKWELPTDEERKTPEPTASAKPPGAPREKSEPLEVLIDHLRVNRGAFVFLDQHGARVAAFSEVQVDSPKLGAGGTQGRASSSKAALRDTIFFENVRTPFSFAAGDLSLNGLEAGLAGGTLHGDLKIRTTEKHSPFTADVRFDGVNLDTLLAEAGGVPGRATGTLAGWLDLYGESGKPETLSGSGRLTLAGGRLQHEFFQLLGQALQIDELAMLNLKQAQLDYRVGDGAVWIDALSLLSTNLQLQAHGTVRLPDGKLQLDARLMVNGRISRQLPAFIDANFQPGSEPDQRFIDFAIGGTAGKPQTNLMERILGRKIEKEMGSLFQNIFKPKKKKPKNESPAPSASPSAAASAPPSTSE